MTKNYIPAVTTPKEVMELVVARTEKFRTPELLDSIRKRSEELDLSRLVPSFSIEDIHENLAKRIRPEPALKPEVMELKMKIDRANEIFMRGLPEIR